MIIRSPEPEVKILVNRDPVKTSFEQWAKPGHFSRTIAKGPDTTTWIWNLHADAHDFDSHTSDLEEISRKVFSAHFVRVRSSYASSASSGSNQTGSDR
jgi:photosystem I P700 chlorophyll a apoprotein A1